MRYNLYHGLINQHSMHFEVNIMSSTPETPESKPKSGFMGMLGKVKDAVSNAMPSEATMDEFKQKVKSQAESVSASVSENIKKVDMNKISDKIKDTVNTVTGKPSENKQNSEDKKDEPK